MNRLFLKSKNHIAKLLLTFLGFTLAASQCLAQYMVILPKTTIHGKLKGFTDTISRFRVVINNNDTFFTSWQEKYTFEYDTDLRTDSLEIEVSEVSEISGKSEKQEYSTVREIIAIKPEENRKPHKEVTIQLKKKK